MRFTIFVTLMAACLGVASAQQALTNSSVVQMVKAGLSESVVVDAIHTQPHQFSLSAGDLIALKQSGVSDAILAAMLTANGSPSGASAGAGIAQQMLTNNSIVQMVKSGQSESFIAAAIQKQPHQFSVFPADLVALNQAGVSKPILEAMMTATFPPMPQGAVATLLNSALAQAKSPITSLTQIHTVTIVGNNEAASDARNDLLKISTKHPHRACFNRPGEPVDPAVTFTLAENDTAGGSGGIFGGTNRETTVVSGELQDASGGVLWSDSKQGIQGVIHTGAGYAVNALLRELYLGAGCTGAGLLKKASGAESHEK